MSKKHDSDEESAKGRPVSIWFDDDTLRRFDRYRELCEAREPGAVLSRSAAAMRILRVALRALEDRFSAEIMKAIERSSQEASAIGAALPRNPKTFPELWYAGAPLDLVEDLGYADAATSAALAPSALPAASGDAS